MILLLLTSCMNSNSLLLSFATVALAAIIPELDLVLELIGAFSCR